MAVQTLTRTRPQTVCGISVVDGDWDALKRYNLTELYSQARNAQNTEAGREEGSQ